MLNEVYAKYFAKDKMLRHVFQHLEVALIGFALTYLLVRFPINIKNILIFIVFSYLPDIDGVTSVLIWSKKNTMAKETVKLLSQFRILDALSYATIHHKQLNRLVLHNVIVYPILLILFIFSALKNQATLTIVLASTLTHLTFDLFDDIKQLGHIQNWLWPIDFNK